MNPSEAPVQRSRYAESDYGPDFENPYPLFKQMRESTPIIEGDFLARFGLPSQAGFVPGRKIFTLFRYADIMAVLRDPATFSSSLINEGLGKAFGGNIITGMDGEEHRKWRGLLGPTFDIRAVATWREGMIEPVIRDEFARPLAARPDKRAELIADFAGFPMSVIYQIIGFPRDAEKERQFATWGVRVKESMLPEPPASAAEAAQNLYRMTLEIVERRRAEGSHGEDLIGHMLRSSFEGAALDDQSIAFFVCTLTPAAVETTTLSFQNMMVQLLLRPDVLERVRNDRSLVLPAINETLRYETPASFQARLVMTDVVIAGVSIPKGSALSLASGSGNRDEAAFKHGDEFDIDRPARPSMGFGFGPHMCVGQHVARLELEAGLNALLDLLPGLRLDPDKPRPAIRGVIKRGPEAIHVAWD